MNDIYDDDNFYYRSVRYYLDRQEYINSSQILYAYAAELHRLFKNMSLDRDSMLAIWSECTKAALLALSCMRLVKPAMQWFIPTKEFHRHNIPIHDIISISQLELDYLKCKAILNILTLSEKDFPLLMSKDNDEYMDTDKLLDELNRYESLVALAERIKKQKAKIMSMSSSILY